MATYDPQVIISAAPGITQYLYLELYEATTPNTPVANSGQLPPPHNASRQIQFTGLNPVIHLAKLFVTDGITTAGTLIANFSIDPKYPGVQIKAPWFIKADTTPGFDSNTATFTDPDGELDGWDYTVEIRQSYGKLNPEDEIDTTGPGYVILIPEYSIQPNEIHIIEFAPKMITFNATSGTGGNLFSDTQLVTADTTIPDDGHGVLYLLASATSTLDIQLPNINNALVNKLFFFSSQGGNHKNVSLNVNGGVIDYMGGNLSTLILGQCEQVWLIKWINPEDDADIRWKCINASDTIRLVGEKVYYDKYLPGDLINYVFADGSELDREVYARLWAYVQTLDASMLVSDATWNTGSDNKGKFSTGDGSTTFRIPLLYSPGYMQGVDGTTRKAGSYAAGTVGPHYHYTIVDVSRASSQFPYQRGTDMVSTNSSKDRSMIKNWSKTGGGAEGYYIDSDNTAPNVSRTSDGGGSANTPSNIGQYILIRC